MEEEFRLRIQSSDSLKFRVDPTLSLKLGPDRDDDGDDVVDDDDGDDDDLCYDEDDTQMLERRLDLRICTSKIMSHDTCLWPLPQFLRNICKTQRNAG